MSRHVDAGVEDISTKGLKWLACSALDLCWLEGVWASWDKATESLDVQ